ncbi:Trans-2-decenoyl-[acyl-carrier-protein] isomerase [bioreactor metagenome]|uniref:Trans-2-decenoyl-[acyl-carrier-protein] isomerase n=1 Tax=bioreactor metagenome TaxID=1076179 RepID=A0A644W982_9ZZZZ
MEFQKIIYTEEAPVATISLNSPKNLNAFDAHMIGEVLAALELCKNNPSVKVVVLNSTGKSFSAGGDIGYMYKAIQGGGGDFSESIEKIAGISLAIKRLSQPVIASVSGAVAGAAFNIALACDFCVAAEDTKFMQAFVNIGLIPDAGGLYLLTRAVGVNKAAELAMTGAPVSAAEAKALGFVCQVVDAEALAQETGKLAKRLAAGPGASFANIKNLIMESSFQDFEAYIAQEVKAQTACGATEDFKEGIRAFVEKRRPNYQ